MPKRKSEKLWQNAHPEKVKEYQQNYLKDKTQATVVIDGWVVSEIDRVKPPEITYSKWVREFLLLWSQQQRQTP